MVTLTNNLLRMKTSRCIKDFCVFILIVFAYLLFKKQILAFFDSRVLPILSNVQFSTLTHIVFAIICCIICFYICRICKRKYNMSSIAICYAMLALAIYAEHRVWGSYCATPNLFYGIGYMDILMLLLGISVIILISIKYFPKKVNQNLNNTESSFILDYPIEAESEDLLNYTSSAHTLAEKIKNIDAKHSCSIGLIAPWGMGKTSYLNILKKCFDDESCIVLKFNPRHSISSDHIQKDFFNLLFSTLGQYDGRFNASFKDYLKAINIIADNLFMTKVLNVHKIWNKSAEKEEVNDAIQHINKRIIVFIDDFDRLLRDEIIEVFKLIDGNASFTNLIFISAYDKEYINTIIECDHSQYNSFADKFFTIEVHLPIRPYAAIYNYLLDNISKLLNVSNEVKEEYNSTIGPNIDIVQRYLPTIRDVKRFLNIFIPRYTMLREEVVFKDYFFLTLIRYRFIDEYHNLRDGHYTNIDIKKGFNQFYVKDGVSCQSIDVLNILFSGDMRFRSINNRSAFNIYFYESVVAGLRIEDMKQMFIIPNLKEVYDYIDNVYKKNMFTDLLAYIESVNIVGFNDFHTFERYIDVVMYILGTNRGNLSTNIAAFGLIYKRSAEQVSEKYNIQEGEYKELLIKKLHGNYPYYPYQLVRDYIFALLKNEIKEEAILSSNDVITIAKESLYELCRIESVVSQQHLRMLYNCVSKVDVNTDKVTLDDDVCKFVGKQIKANPIPYFESFVRLGRVSSSPDFNTIACEPFWEQIFGNASDFNSYIEGLTEKEVPNILRVKNFWKLYKANDYAPIEYNNQGSVQAKIDNDLREEVKKLNMLIDLEKEFNDLYSDSKSSLPSEKSVYIARYNRCLTAIDNIGLYVKFTGNLRAQISQAISEIEKV